MLIVTLFRYRKRSGADCGYPGAKRGRGRGHGRFHGRAPRQDRRSSEKSPHPSESVSNNSDSTLDQLMLLWIWCNVKDKRCIIMQKLPFSGLFSKQRKRQNLKFEELKF